MKSSHDQHPAAKATPRKMRDIPLAASERHLRKSLEASIDGIIIVDEVGTVLEYNQAAQHIFGYERDQVIGKSMASLFVPERHRAAHVAGMARFVRSREKRIIGKPIEIEAMRADGSEFLAVLSIKESDSRDGMVFIGYIRDITEKRRAESALIAAKEKAEHANRAQAEFLAMMSHEIRTPLNGLLGILSLLMDSDLSEEQHEYVRIGERSGQGLLRIINDILDYSKIESGEFSFEANDFDLYGLVAGVIDIVSPKAQEKSLALNFDVATSGHTHLKGDEERLRQILVNLADNAVKFTDEGSITITVTSEPAENDRRHLLFEVVDTGIGIADDHVEDLFKKFTTASPSYQRQQGGTGLGLAICKTLIGAMGGEIGMRSNDTGGSTFWFRVTLDESSPEEAEAGKVTISDRSQILSATNGEQLRILIAEDNSTNAMITRVMLAEAGYELDVVTDGAQALKAVAEKDYDLVLMDIGMPVMDGVEAAARIRQLPGRKANVPIIALTAHVLKDHRMPAMMRDMDDYIAKPVRRDTMLKTVASWALGLRTRIAYIHRTDDIRDPSSAGANETNTRPRDREDGEGDSVPMLDTAALDQLRNDTSPQILLELIEDFLLSTDGRIEALKEATCRQNPEDLCLHAHALGSSAATFGARRLYALVGDIEAACKNQDYQRAYALAAQIDRIGGLSLRALARHLKQLGEEQGDVFTAQAS